MADDYTIEELRDLVNDVLNPAQAKNDEWLLRYLRFHAVIYYFEYAVAAVKSQRAGFKDGQPEDSPIIVGSAISAYAHMHACVTLFDLATRGFSSPKWKNIKGVFRELTRRIKKLRDRTAAHPEEDKKKGKGANSDRFIMSKRSAIRDDGTVWVRQISIREPHGSEKLELTPRADLAKLRDYLRRAVTTLRPVIEAALKS